MDIKTEQNWADFLLRHRVLTILLSSLFVLICSFGVQYLTVDGSIDALMDDDYAGKVEHYKVMDDFTESTSLQIIVDARVTPQGDNQQGIYTQEYLKMLRDLTDQAWQIPYASRVDSLTNFQHTYADGDDLQVNDLVGFDLAIDETEIEKIKQVVRSEPTIINNLASSSEHLAVVSVSVDVPIDETLADAYTQIISHTNKLLDEYREKHDAIDFHLTGTVLIEHATRVYIDRDSAQLIPLMLGIIIFVLWILLRSIPVTLAATSVVILTGSSTMGVLGWMGVVLDSASSVAAIVVMTLAVADVIHLVVGVANGIRMGKTQREAIIYSAQLNLLPIFLTSITTALGVITFSFSELPSLKILGVAIAIGAMIALLLTLTLLPALLSYLKVHPSKQHSNKLLGDLAAFVINHHKQVVVFGLLISIVIAVNIGRNVLNESPEIFFEPQTPERQVIDLMKSEMSGVVKFDIALYSDKESFISTPEYLQILDEFSVWLREQAGVGHVASFADTIKRLNKNMHGDDPQWYRLPETKELASQYLLLYELSLPYGLDLNYQINLDKSATRVFVSTEGIYAAEAVQLKESIHQWFKQHYPEMRLGFGGWGIVMQELVYNDVLPSMLKGGAVAFAFISLILLLVFRNLKYGLIGISANLIPVAVGYGIWGLINGTANFAVVCVAGVCLGIVIDFAVHFLSKYQLSRNRQANPLESVRYAYEKVALPLLVTTVVLVCGFWILTLSPLSLNSGLGLLTGIIIILALLYDLLILPAILVSAGKEE